MLTADMVKRRLIFDCMADPQRVGLLAGLTGVSEEGAEVEEKASMERLGAIAHLYPQLHAIAEWMAEATTALNLANVEEGVVTPEFAQHMEHMLFTAIQGSLVAAFSVLNDLGAIHIPEE